MYTGGCLNMSVHPDTLAKQLDEISKLIDFTVQPLQVKGQETKTVSLS